MGNIILPANNFSFVLYHYSGNMAQQDDLFELIKSLTPSEKRYFKLQAKRHLIGKRKSNYEKLFDAVNYWPAITYDEKQFRKKHKGKAFIKNLANEKNYLLELLFKVMRNHAENPHRINSLLEQIMDINFLIQKGLKNQARLLLDKCIEQIEERQSYFLLPLAYDIYNSLHIPGHDKLNESTEEMEARENRLMNKIVLQRRANILRLKIFDFENQTLTSGALKDEGLRLISEVENMLSHPDLPALAEIYLVWVKQMFLSHTGRHRDNFNFSKSYIDKILSNPNPYVHNNARINTTLYNFLDTATELREWETIPAYLEHLGFDEKGGESEKISSFVYMAQVKLSYIARSGNYFQYKGYFKEVEGDLKKYGGRIGATSKIDILSRLAQAELLNGEFGPSLNHIQLIEKEIGRDKQWVTFLNFILNIKFMAMISIGHTENIDNDLRNLKRHFTSNIANNEFSDSIFHFYNTLIKNADLRSSTVKQSFDKIASSSPNSLINELIFTIRAWVKVDKRFPVGFHEAG